MDSLESINGEYWVKEYTSRYIHCIVWLSNIRIFNIDVHFLDDDDITAARWWRLCIQVRSGYSFTDFSYYFISFNIIEYWVVHSTWNDGNVLFVTYNRELSDMVWTARNYFGRLGAALNLGMVWSRLEPLNVLEPLGNFEWFVATLALWSIWNHLEL